MSTISAASPPVMRLLFVITEHEGGLTADRRDGYEAIRRRLASITTTAVDSTPYWEIDAPAADALILSGSADPWAAHDPSRLDRFYEILRSFDGPAFGICAGMQMMARAYAGVVAPARRATRGLTRIDVLDDSDLLAGTGPGFDVFQSHEDEITELPPGFRLLATSETCQVEAIAADDRPWWGTQFHPEALEPGNLVGRTIVERFLELSGVGVSRAGGPW